MGGWRYSSTILDLCNKWTRVVSFTPRPLCPPSGEIAPSTNCIGGWVGPTDGLDAVEKKKKVFAETQTSAFQPLARRYTD
jgi:hypothetical protein